MTIEEMQSAIRRLRRLSLTSRRYADAANQRRIILKDPGSKRDKDLEVKSRGHWADVRALDAGADALENETTRLKKGQESA